MVPVVALAEPLAPCGLEFVDKMGSCGEVLVWKRAPRPSKSSAARRLASAYIFF
jgi:hypothetical protein